MGKTTPNFQRLRLSVAVLGPQTLRILALLARAATGHDIALSGEMERAATGVTGTRYFHPSHLAESTVPPEFAPFPAAMRVGCQASTGRFPSATLDESERNIFGCWGDCI